MCFLIFHRWKCYHVYNYIDVSYGDEAKSHIIFFVCKDCKKTKNIHKYGVGILNDQQIQDLKDL